jgi:hypothetical protein
MTAAQNITQLFTGYKWTTTTITYTFLTEYAPYTPQASQEPGGPTVLSAEQQAATRQLFADVQSFLGVQFVEVIQDNSQDQIGQIAIGMRNNLLVPTWVGQTEANLSLPGQGATSGLKLDLTATARLLTHSLIPCCMRSDMHLVWTIQQSEVWRIHRVTPSSQIFKVTSPQSCNFTTSARCNTSMMRRPVGIQAAPSTPTLPAIRWNPFGIPAGMIS